MIFSSIIVFAACVVLLVKTNSPALAAGVFAAGKIGFAFVFGSGIVSVIAALVISALAFGYFWLLDRFDGSPAWWGILLGGVLLLG